MEEHTRTPHEFDGFVTQSEQPWRDRRDRRG